MGNMAKPFEKRIWLATPTMHGDEIRYVQEAYDTNWMSTVGENINITSWEIDGETVERGSDFTFGGSKITADGDSNMKLKDAYCLEESYVQPR